MEVLLDITVEPDGRVHGIVNPGRQHAPIQRGHFDAALRTVQLEGEVILPDGNVQPFRIHGHLDQRTLRLTYAFGDRHGDVETVRVEEYRPARVTLFDWAKSHFAAVRRRIGALTRPKGAMNAARLRARNELPESVVFRDATASDIPALAALHVATWNATYRTTRGPTVATRSAQWNAAFAKASRRDFVLVLENRDHELVGFTWGLPHDGQCAGKLSKIYLRFDYHGLGLGKRMLAASAQRFLARDIGSFVLFADIDNPTIGFFDHMGGERLIDERGLFTGGYAWRDVRVLL